MKNLLLTFLLGALAWPLVVVSAVAEETTTLASGSTSPDPVGAPVLATRAPSLGLRETGLGESAPATSSTSASPATPAPSSNAMVNLVNLLVGQKVITREAGNSLIKQAEEEADTARAQNASTQAVAERALVIQSLPSSAPAPSTAAATPAPSDDVEVNYVPDTVKNQIRDEVTETVLRKTREEDFATKSDIPAWLKRFRIGGDVRLRYEGDFYPTGNSTGSFTNFNSINTGSGFVIGSSLFPQYNVDRDRNRFRLRARIGADIDLTHNFTLGLRVGTGADNSPVTENQTLGVANSGQGGNFSKYAIWLDRAFIRYEIGTQPDRGVTVTVGRFDNPFFHTSMIWSDDLGFDGAVVQARYKVAEGVTPFFVAGGFPVFNTDYNFSSVQAAKSASEDKYLLGTQLGTNWTINKNFSAKVAAAYYHFIDVEGKVSDAISSDSLPGNTDDSRPSFAQNGNTYIALRNYQDPLNPTHTGETQYFGLATPFHVLALTAQVDYNGFDPFHIWLTGEFAKNVAFDRGSILNNGSPNFPGPFNNLNNPSDPNSFAGGDTGAIGRLNLGKVALERFGDWNLNLGYRYVESDAVIDGFTESDFGAALAGTNLKGYTVGGNLAFSPQVFAGLRWMSADAVAGPTYRNDLIQFDINAKF